MTTSRVPLVSTEGYAVWDVGRNVGQPCRYLRNARKRAIPSLGGRGLLLNLARHDADRVRDHKHHIALLAFQRRRDVLGQGLLGDVEKRCPKRFIAHGQTSSVPGRWPAGWRVRVQ